MTTSADITQEDIRLAKEYIEQASELELEDTVEAIKAVTSMNREQRRAAEKAKKLHLTKKPKVVRGRTYYGNQDITEYKNLGMFNHVSSIMKLKQLNISAQDVLDMKAESEAIEATEKTVAE